MALRLRRGTEAERLLIIPLQGEPVFTTDTKKLYIGDGATPGGILVTGDTSNTEVLADETPQLGGDLDLNGNNITGSGNIAIDGTITATGNISLGDDSGDQVNINGEINLGGLINTNLRPAIDGAYDIGSGIRRWNSIWVESAEVGGQINSEIISTGKIIASDSSVLFDADTSTVSASVVTSTTLNAVNITNASGNLNLNAAQAVTANSNTNIQFSSTNGQVGFATTGGNLILSSDGNVNLSPNKTITGNLIGDILAADGSEVLENGTDGTNAIINATLRGESFGTHNGDVIGSLKLSGHVYGEDSTIIIDGTNNSIDINTITLAEQGITLSGAKHLDFRNSDSSRNATLRLFNGEGGTWVETYGTIESGYPVGANHKVSKGTLDTPTTVNPGDLLLQDALQTYDGTDYTLSSSITHAVDPNQTVSAGTVPGLLALTTFRGGNPFTDYGSIILDSQGNVTINHPLGTQAEATLDINGFAKLAPLDAEPSSPTVGMIAVADFTNWDPLSTTLSRPYVVFYDGAGWQAMSPI